MNTADDFDALHPGPDPDKLERFNRLQLSAMLDGELGQDEARFLRRRLEHDAELSGCFERWQVCGDVLRGRQVSLLPADFAERIARGIAAGEVVLAPAASARRPRLLRWGGGAALAASVALIALFVGRPAPTLDAPEAAAPLVADAPSAGAPLAVDAAADASALTDAPPGSGVAVAGAAALAVADVPRRQAVERASRGQSQRAALRAAQARQQSATRVASADPMRAPIAPRPADPLPRADSLLASAAASVALPVAPSGSRPWPKASSFAADGRFSARYSDSFPAPSFARPATSDVLPAFPVEAPQR